MLNYFTVHLQLFSYLINSLSLRPSRDDAALFSMLLLLIALLKRPSSANKKCIHWLSRGEAVAWNVTTELTFAIVAVVWLPLRFTAPLEISVKSVVKSQGILICSAFMRRQMFNQCTNNFRKTATSMWLSECLCFRDMKMLPHTTENWYFTATIAQHWVFFCVVHPLHYNNTTVKCKIGQTNEAVLS